MLSKCVGFRKAHTKPHTGKQNYAKTSHSKIPNGNFHIRKKLVVSMITSHQATIGYGSKNPVPFPW